MIIGHRLPARLSFAVSFCSTAKKSSIFSTFASATMVQNGSPLTSVSRRIGSCPISFNACEMRSELFDHLAHLPGFAVQDFTDHIHDVLL